ncbi:MAG: hypothetical protein AB7K09_24010 [Planctomycetota bacterium]
MMTIEVELPPRIDLHQFQTIGVLPFNGTANDSMRHIATQRWLATMIASQPGIRVLELPTPVGALPPPTGMGQPAMSAPRSLTPAEVVELGQQHHVDAVLTAEFNVSDARTGVRVSIYGNVNVRSDVAAQLNAVIRDTTQGAIVWTNGAHGTWNIGGMNANSRGATIGVSEPDARADKMINDLVRIGTLDFRPRYEKRRVPKDQPPPPPPSSGMGQ